MNKIFKVVWSKVKHCYVVVSEIAKNTISGGARRSRVRKGALAAALVTTIFGSSFVMPNSAWAAPGDWWPGGDQGGSQDYDGVIGNPNSMGDMGYSYEALIVLSATKNEIDGTVSFGIDLYRGDSGTAYLPGTYTYLNGDEIEALKDTYSTFIPAENYAYTKVTSVGAQTEFTTVLEETIQQTVIQEVISSVEEGSNIIVTPQYDSNNNLTSFVIDAKDTTYEVLTGQKDSSGTTTYTVKSSALDGNGKHLQWEIKDTNTTYTVTEDTNLGSNEVSKWNVNEIGNENNPIATITDTDTKVLSGSVVNDNPDTGKYNVKLETNDAQGSSSILIENLHDYHITGVTVDSANNNVKFNHNNGGSYTLNFVAGGGNREEGDTYVQIGGADGITLNTGSKVSANDGQVTQEAPTLENITINGQKYTIAAPSTVVDTNTYVDDVSVGGVEGNSNAAKVNFIHNDGTEGYEVTFVGEGSVNVSTEGENVVISAMDTNTTYTVTESERTGTDAGNVVKKWNIKSQANGEGAYTDVGTVVDTDTRVTSGSATYDGANGTITLTNNDGTTAPITGLHDYHITGVTVDSANNNVKFNHNNGGSYTLNFVAGGGNREEGDTYVQIGGTDGITLNTGSKVSANDGQVTQEAPTLENITINGQKYTIAAPSTVVDTNTTYTVEESGRTGDDAGNVVKKWEIKSQANGESAYTDVGTVVDTDTRVTSGSATYDGANGTITLTNNDGTTAPITGLHDYHITGVTVDSANNNVKFNHNNGGSYTLNFVAGGGNREEGDTYVKISVPNGDNEITLNTGSMVSANDGQTYQKDQVLEDITINGQKYTIAAPSDVVDTNDYINGVTVVEGSDGKINTTYSYNTEGKGSISGVSFVAGENVGLEVADNTITISATDANTTYEVSPVEKASLSGNQVNQWKVNEIGNENNPIATITDTDTKVLSGSVVEGENGSYGINLVTNVKDDDGKDVIVPISGLHDYYTTGVSVSGNDVVFNRNDGGSYGVNFAAGGGKLNDQGKPEDTYVEISVPNGKNSIKLATGSMVSANDGQTYQKDQVLEDITINGQKYTLGYSWGLEVEGDKGNSGGIEVGNGQTLKLAEGENVSLAYNNGTITISALVKAEGKYADWQQPATRGRTTNDAVGLPQLSKLTVDGKEYSIPTINEVINPDSDAPLLKAVELNGKEYRIADPAWTVKVANGDAVSSFDVTDGDDVEYVAGSNIVLSAEATKDENDGITGGKIVVTTAKDVVFDSVTVGGKTSGNVVIDSSGIAMGNQKITGLAAGVADTDAVNVSQLRDVVTSSITANEQHLVVNPDSQDGKYKVDGNTVTLKVQGKDANGGTVYTDVVIDDVASAEYVDNKFTTIEGEINSLDDRVTVVENSIESINQNIANVKTEVEAGSNITVVEDEIDGGGKKYTISATDTNTVNQHMDGTGWMAGSDGKATDDLLIKVNDSDGKSVEATIKDVAKASDLKQEREERQEADSVLAGAIINNQQNVQNLNAGLNKLGSRMNKVGAGSAALAALHPMDFDPDDKLQFSAGVGHYGGENAAALGAFYRPTEKVMFSVAGTMGNGEDMVNAGVTFALDKPNNVSNSRVAMAREIQDLRQQVAALTMLVMQMASRDNAALAGVAMFPDVPENHWAYDYIEGLQKQGIIEGYPDGNFGGDRSMTRYEFAAMLYRALEKGFPVDSRLLNEFNAELGRIRVDRIKGADNDAKKVERVRVNADVDRDDYGSKIVQVKAGA